MRRNILYGSNQQLSGLYFKFCYRGGKADRSGGGGVNESTEYKLITDSQKSSWSTTTMLFGWDVCGGRGILERIVVKLYYGQTGSI